MEVYTPFIGANQKVVVTDFTGQLCLAWPQLETRTAESVEWGSLGGGSKPPPHQLGRKLIFIQCSLEMVATNLSFPEARLHDLNN